MRRDELKFLSWVVRPAVCWVRDIPRVVVWESLGYEKTLGMLRKHPGKPRGTHWEAHGVRARVRDSMGYPKEWVGCPEVEKVGSPRETPTHHTAHTLWETFQPSSSRPSEAAKTGKRKKWGRKEREEGKLLHWMLPTLFREEKGGAIAPPFSCEMSDALSSFDTAPREPRRKCH